MTVLDNLFNGEIYPGDEPFINPAYKNAISNRDKYYSELEELLDKDGRKILHDFWASSIEMEFEYGKEMFKKGFSLAFKISAECFDK